MKEVPVPANLPGWATAAASLISAFSAWTRRYFAFPLSSSLSSFERAERKPEPPPLSLSLACVCARFVDLREAAFWFQCAGLIHSAEPYIILVPAVSNVTVAFPWNSRALLEQLEIQAAEKSLESSQCILMYLWNLKCSSGEFTLARHVFLRQLLTLKVYHFFTNSIHPCNLYS